MALKTFKPTSPGLRQVVLIDRSDLWKGDPVKSLTEGTNSLAAATTTATSRRVITAAVIAGATASSISSAASSTSPARSSASSTIRTAPPSSRWCAIRTAKLNYILAPQR